MMAPATNPLALVDPDLPVHGLDALRVANAAIMPTGVSGNTNAALHHDRREMRGDDAGYTLSRGATGGDNSPLPGLLRSLNVRLRHKAAS